MQFKAIDVYPSLLPPHTSLRWQAKKASRGIEPALNRIVSRSITPDVLLPEVSLVNLAPITTNTLPQNLDNQHLLRQTLPNLVPMTFLNARHPWSLRQAHTPNTSYSTLKPSAEPQPTTPEPPPHGSDHITTIHLQCNNLEKSPCPTLLAFTFWGMSRLTKASPCARLRPIRPPKPANTFRALPVISARRACKQGRQGLQ